MKQFITQSQYNELSDAAKQAYITWTLAKSNETGDHTVSYRSIGHFIWFLDEHITHGWWHVERDGNKQCWRVDSKYLAFPSSEQPELCDALWEAIKDYLEAEYEGTQS